MNFGWIKKMNFGCIWHGQSDINTTEHPCPTAAARACAPRDRAMAPAPG